VAGTALAMKSSAELVLETGSLLYRIKDSIRAD
jgi:hypothetical protein